MTKQENHGKIVPPVWLAFSLVTMFLLNLLFPVLEITGPFFWGFAASFMISGLFIMIISARLFAKASTGIVPFSETTAVVVEGPYKLTRNPMYLGMVLILIGAAFGLGSLLPFFVIPAFAWLTQTQFILPEEKFMEEHHGEAYLAYKARVRRWI